MWVFQIAKASTCVLAYLVDAMIGQAMRCGRALLADSYLPRG